MTIRELDRLVSKTELTPASKLMLRQVRKAVMRGKVDGPHMTRYTWTVGVNDFGGPGARFVFKLKRDDDDQATNR